MWKNTLMKEESCIKKRTFGFAFCLTRLPCRCRECSLCNQYSQSIKRWGRFVLQIWQTTCGGFKNESQNYSQIALASLVNFDALVQQDGDTVFLVQGDKYLKKYHKRIKTLGSIRITDKYSSSLRTGFYWWHDFLRLFMKRVNAIRKEYTYIASAITNSDKEIVWESTLLVKSMWIY